MNNIVKPQIAWGVNRFILHNPFGTLSGQVFQADQMLEAQAAGLSWLTNDFVSAWQPIVASGVEVVAYIGSPVNDASFSGLSDANWSARFASSISLFRQAGMSIAFDMSMGVLPGSRDWLAVQDLKAQGVKVYGEPRPSEGATHWLSENLIAEESEWAATNPELIPTTVGWKAKNAQLTGEVVRVLFSPALVVSAQAQWIVDNAKSILREGNTVAIQVDQMMRSGRTLRDITG